MKSEEEIYQIAYQIHYKAENLQVAYLLYGKLISLYPNSHEADYARSRLNNIEKDERFSPASIEDTIQAEEILNADIANPNFWVQSMIHSAHKNGAEARGYKPIMMTTGFDFSGYSIDQYLGIVASESVAGLGLLRALKGNLANLFGTESESLIEQIEETREESIRKLHNKATNMNANGIIGVSFNYTMFDGTMIGITASGTAVRISKRTVPEKPVIVPPSRRET